MCFFLHELNNGRLYMLQKLQMEFRPDIAGYRIQSKPIVNHGYDASTQASPLFASDFIFSQAIIKIKNQ